MISPTITSHIKSIIEFFNQFKTFWNFDLNYFQKITTFAFIKDTQIIKMKRMLKWSQKSNPLYEIELNRKTTWMKSPFNRLPRTRTHAYKHTFLAEHSKNCDAEHIYVLISISGRCYIYRPLYIIRILFGIRFILFFSILHIYIFNNETKYRRFDVWRVHKTVSK